ncbi:MAG: glycoside hydrolase family 32 protein [Williamsia sp.]|nr:glycoside hydrolase family 32 protein [Williamsia sp.]
MKNRFRKIFVWMLAVAALPGALQSQTTNGNASTQDTTWKVTDPFYPLYHVAPPYGWMNDPHPVYFNGAYHLFYQFSYVRDNPYGRIGLQPGQRPRRTWGHAMSTDLVHWKHMPIALNPEQHGRPGDPHVFSGMVVDDGGTGTILYTINNIDIWMATSKDKDLASFTRYTGNPVVKGPPPGLGISGQMRDPWVWKEGNSWYMIIGSGLAAGKGPVIPLYKSTDLVNWQYLHPLYRADSSQFDLLGDAEFCECPAFFKLGSKWVLVFSDKTTCLVGRYERQRFIPESRTRLDWGEDTLLVKNGGIYVPEFALDNKGRRIMWGWMGGWWKARNDVQELIKAGWSGAQTLPRVVTLDAEGALNFEPAEELNALRKEHKGFSAVNLTADSSSILEGVQGLQLEIKAVIKPGTSKNFGVELLGVQEETRIFYDVSKKSLCYNGTSVPLPLDRNENLELRLFIDGRLLEIYANKKVVLTEDLKPAGTDGYRVQLFARNGRANAVQVDAWKMGTIW